MTIDRLKAMEAFVRVAELGSFTQAAEALRMAKPTVSLLVQQLEAHLKVHLLRRTTRRVTLTPDGAILLERGSALLQEFAEMELQVRGALVKPAGLLRVDVPSAVGRHMLMPSLPAFFKRFPDIVLEVGSTDRPVDLVREGVDCVVRGGNIYDESLVARKLGAYKVITCAAPKYLARHGKPRTLGDLEKHHFVNFFSAKTGRVFPFEFFKGDEKHEIMRPHRVSANDAGSYVAAGLAGMGLMQLPASRAVREQIAQGTLVQVMKDWEAGELPMYVLYPRNRHLSARIRAFADWMMEIFQEEFEDGPAR
jgi:LysR family transcriptional regulator, regulator for bpeEF and oprC